jgi:hypothetical protein
MKTAYIDLIKYALRSGHTVSVWDGEEWQVKRSTSLRAITEAVKSVEEATLRIRDTAGFIVGAALVAAYGLEPDETVMDHSGSDFMESWDSVYTA